MLFRRKKANRVQQNKELLEQIKRLKQELVDLSNIINHSVDPSDKGIYDLAVAQVKYYYLLREARYRNVSAKFK